MAVERLTVIERSLEGGQPYWASQVEVQHLTAAAWLAHADQDDANAERLMRAAADLEDGTEKHAATPGPLVPARQLYPELLLSWVVRATLRERWTPRSCLHRTALPASPLQRVPRNSLATKSAPASAGWN